MADAELIGAWECPKCLGRPSMKVDRSGQSKNKERGHEMKRSGATKAKHHPKSG
jgi:hypothetical protein